MGIALIMADPSRQANILTRVTGENQQYMHAGWIRAKTIYMQDFLQGLAARDAAALAAVFAVDIQNELCFYPGDKPFSLSGGRFTALDGRVYDTHEQPRLWNAADHESAIFKILADGLR